MCNSLYALELSNYDKKIKSSYNITSVTEKLSRDDLEKNLRDFASSGRPSRAVGSPGHNKSLEFIKAKLTAANSKGANFSKQEFSQNSDKVAKEVKGINLIWEKKGLIKPDEVIILGANYDTILIDAKTQKIDLTGSMPGADNNATGVSALLSMIEIFDKLDLPKTVRIVFFDFEELGLIGSRAYVEKMLPTIGNQKIAGFINLTMLGHDSKREDKEKKFNNMKVYLRPPTSKGSEDDLKLVTLLNNNGKRLYPNIDFIPEANGLNLSSQASFWEVGIPALCFSQNWESDFNPRFRTSNDFVETLNINTYTNAFRYITGSLLAWNYDIVK